ncbi:hypothetical protein OY671_008603, partial [Metschnikowia pulcherrima]
HPDHATFTHTLPWQTDDQGLQLLIGECHSMSQAMGWPDEAASIAPPCGQPDADTIVHQHLQAVGSAVGKQIGMVWMGGSEDFDHTSQRGIGACPHVQWFDSQPGRIDSDHLSQSRNHCAQAAAPSSGQFTVTTSVPRRTSTRISDAAARVDRSVGPPAGSRLIGTNAGG